MAYIKKLVMHGFKSFARRTEIIFDKGINVVLGPNGSGKSNVSDALCFVLGRLSIKSMRAAKSKNLLFMGSKYIKPAREANVELVFDNTDRVFGIDKDEIILSRTVKHNGQGIYKINGETKTRIEIIELLAQAGIDPHGYNLVLQGQIQAIVKMHPDERRKVIEEVAGISIYELRKEKSLHELEKTEGKLKEITAILREKSAYLKNLEKERGQALRAKELEITTKRAKLSILNRNVTEKNKEIENITESIIEKNKQKDKIKEKAIEKYSQIEKFNLKIQEINRLLQSATGIEQETLHLTIANLKADLEGLRVRREGYEHRKVEVERRISEMQKAMPELEEEIKNLTSKSPIVAAKNEELKKRKEELSELEEEKKKFHTLKADLSGVRERLRDKERALNRAQAESEAVMKQIEDYTRLCIYKDEKECQTALDNLREELQKNNGELEEISKAFSEADKKLSISYSEIDRANKIMGGLKKIDICPLCQSKITDEHINHVVSDCNETINKANEIITKANSDRESAITSKRMLQESINLNNNKLRAAEIEFVRHKTIKEKHEQLKRTVADEKSSKNEIDSLDKKRAEIEMKIAEISSIEDKYDSKMAEIEEISARNEENIDNTIIFRQRDLENTKNIIKRSQKDFEEIQVQITELTTNLEQKRKILFEREKQERELNERFKKMFEERDNIQHTIQESNLEVSEMQSSIRQIEDQVNYLKIGIAKLDAERQTINMEIAEFPQLELIQGSVAFLQEKLVKAQEALRDIGAINMRALEVYDEIKKEYDFVEEKTQVLQKEKEQIMAIIQEIDKKKIRSFMKTFRGLNELFTQNFSRVYSKGSAFLEIENPQDVFSGGVAIGVKLAKGKYFDVTSLSGGEQTLVALSLLFAIQEYRPYHFYVFDEIDAALDKRNSERLAALLTQYMKSGQYIVITHNDAIIMNANVLYGVSMHDGVSKILSLNLGEKMPQTGFELKPQDAQIVEVPTQSILEENENASDEINEEKNLEDQTSNGLFNKTEINEDKIISQEDKSLFVERVINDEDKNIS